MLLVFWPDLPASLEHFLCTPVLAFLCFCIRPPMNTYNSLGKPSQHPGAAHRRGHRAWGFMLPGASMWKKAQQPRQNLYATASLWDQAEATFCGIFPEIVLRMLFCFLLPSLPSELRIAVFKHHLHLGLLSGNVKELTHANDLEQSLAHNKNLINIVDIRMSRSVEHFYKRWLEFIWAQ